MIDLMSTIRLGNFEPIDHFLFRILENFKNIDPFKNYIF